MRGKEKASRAKRVDHKGDKSRSNSYSSRVGARIQVIFNYRPPNIAAFYRAKNGSSEILIFSCDLDEGGNITREPIPVP